MIETEDRDRRQKQKTQKTEDKYRRQRYNTQYREQKTETQHRRQRTETHHRKQKQMTEELQKTKERKHKTDTQPIPIPSPFPSPRLPHIQSQKKHTRSTDSCNSHDTVSYRLLPSTISHHHHLRLSSSPLIAFPSATCLPLFSLLLPVSLILSLPFFASSS
jgi:hypothetical protein